MLLRCPHCREPGEHRRSDFLGDWVVCPSCELPFAWRQSQADEEKEGERKRDTTDNRWRSTRK